MENNEAKFEAYFTGKMSENEIENFNAELATDEKMKDEFSYFISLKKASSSIESDKLRVQLSGYNIDDSSRSIDAKSESSSTFLSRMKWLLGMVTLCLIVYFVYNSFTSAKPDQLFAQNFELYEVQATRGESNDEINSYYSQGNYKEVIRVFSTRNNSPEVSMMLANAYIETNDFLMAEKILVGISDESSLRDLKYWNLGLINLQLNNTIKAESYFRHLQTLSNFKKSEINTILSHIKN